MSQFSRFLLVGLVNTFLGYAVIFGCMYLGKLSPELSNIVGYTVGLFISYFLNRYFTFRCAQSCGLQFVRFALVFLVAYFANFATLVVFVRFFAINSGFSQIIAGIMYVVTAYLLNKNYVFRTVHI